METILCYSLKEEPLRICTSEQDWIKYKSSIIDYNFINSLCFVNDGPDDVNVSGTILKTGMYKVVNTPTPTGTIDIREIKVEFSGSCDLKVILQRASNFYYKKIETL